MVGRRTRPPLVIVKGLLYRLRFWRSLSPERREWGQETPSKQGGLMSATPSTLEPEYFGLWRAPKGAKYAGGHRHGVLFPMRRLWCRDVFEVGILIRWRQSIQKPISMGACLTNTQVPQG